MKNSIWSLLFLLIFPFVLSSCSSSESSPQEEMEMIKDKTLEGNYFGGWTSTTSTGAEFTNFPISAIFQFANNEQTILSGKFFATSNYVSCCNTTAGANDGTMNLVIDDNTITSFTFNDTIIDCTGSFTGNGSINAAGNLIIDFTGTDCDGEHVGQLIFRKEL